MIEMFKHYTLTLNKVDNSNKEVLVFDRFGWPL